jgi:hypothetical protein
VAPEGAARSVVHSASGDLFVAAPSHRQVADRKEMIEYSHLKYRDELVARACRSKERLDGSTRDDRDQQLHDLLVRTHPSRESQLS